MGAVTRSGGSLSFRVHRRGSRQRESGFTLIEVLVSLVLAAITMIGVMALYRAQTNASSFSRRSTEATALAEDQLEKLRLETGIRPVTVGTFDETGKAVVGGTFTRTFQVTQPTSTHFDMTVRVEWSDEGLTKSVTLTGKRNAL
jgi:prepilin-type N-terminal cleavage/methylation domain-containing protein